MTAARCWDCLIGGAVIAGTALDRFAGLPRAGDQFVLAGDFHVHAFVGDGGVPPWELGREARRRGLDVIVVSNHNQLLGPARGAGIDALWANRAPIIPRAGDHGPGFHTFGRHRRRSTGGCPLREAIAADPPAGGVAIAAHPGLPGSLAHVDEERDGWRERRRIRGRDARKRELERVSYQRRRQSAIAMTSDFHWRREAGFLFWRVQVGSADAVRRGATVASDGDGT